MYRNQDYGTTSGNGHVVNPQWNSSTNTTVPPAQSTMGNRLGSSTGVTGTGAATNWNGNGTGVTGTTTGTTTGTGMTGRVGGTIRNMWLKTKSLVYKCLPFLPGAKTTPTTTPTTTTPVTGTTGTVGVAGPAVTY